MCGIIGMNKADKGVLSAALSAFKYRGPDHTGYFTSGDIILGHNRLAILDLDKRSNQPFIDKDKKLAIVYNGEIYNFKELREGPLKNYAYHTESDTEVLLNAYKKYGTSLTKYVKGMYAFAIFDQNKNRIFLFRDHTGIKPLYYYLHDGLFIFSSELKGIITVLNQYKKKLALNQRAVDMYITLGYIPSPLTLYKEVYKLRPRHYLEFDILEKRVLENEEVKIPVKRCNSEKELEELIENRIIGHLMADVPVGLFFSGGTDSSLIAAILNKHGVNLETFSIRMSHKTDDSYYFKEISKVLKLKSSVYNFGLNEFEKVYEEVMARIDEPVNDASLFPTYYISQMAATKVKVVLSGEGGDEFFYGYPRQQALMGMNDTQDFEMDWLDRLFFTLQPLRGKNRIFRKINKVLNRPYGYYLSTMTYYEHASGFREWKRIFKERKMVPLDIDKTFYLENDLLRKIDFATSYNSIEGRVPLLDIDIVENTKYLQSEIMGDGRTKKIFLKKILKKYLPDNLVFRGKSGFGLRPQLMLQDNSPARFEFIKACDYLQSRGVVKIKLIGREKYFIARYPNFVFSLLFLYRTLINNESL